MNLLEINSSKLIEVLGSDPEKGLTSEEVEKNRAEFSPTHKKGKRAVIGDYFGDILPIVFVILSAFSLFVKKEMDALVALALLFFVYIGFKLFVSSYNKKVMLRINEKQAKAKVLREGEVSEIDFSELVQGDVILLSFGDVVPCDAIIIERSALRVSEVQLTGNSAPVLKIAQEDVVRGKGVPYYECILFAGSVIVEGSAKAIVCNTGREVFDKKNKLTTRSRHARHTRLFEISDFFSKNLSLIWILVTLVTFIVGVVKGNDPFGVFYLALTLAVSAFPDFLITLFDLTLTVGSSRLLKRDCVIRDMTAIDRMCDISCIAVDNSRYFRTSYPRPVTVYVNGEEKKFRACADPDVRALFELALAASVSGDGGMTYNGVSVERSLISAGEDVGLTRKVIYDKYLLLEKKPYDDLTRTSRVIYFKDGEFFTVTLGSPSAVLKASYFEMKNGEKLPLLQRDKNSLRELAHAIAESGEGVVAIAVKKIEYKEGADQISSERGFTFMGYIGLHTSIKADAARAVNLSKKSSIDVVLMTSEPRHTSIGFAKSLSIMKENERVVTADEFASLDEGVFRTEIKDYKVFVSLAPEDKRRVVSWRKEEGDIVASVVSDIDSFELLLESDVSFSSSESSDGVIVQNSDVVINGGFELIPECIKYARLIYRNVRHSLEYLLSFQFLLLFMTLLPVIFNGAPILTPTAILLFATTVALPISTSLAIEGVRGNELKGSFGKENLGINIYNLILVPSISALVSAVVMTLSARFSAVGEGSFAAAAFITLVSSSVFTAYSLSMDTAFEGEVFKNKEMLFVSLGVVALSSAVVFTPFSSLLGMTIPKVTTALLAFVTGVVPALFCMGIKLINKYVFGVIKNKKI